MNFFEHQDRARKQTGRLVFLFILAVVALILAIYAVILVVAGFSGAHIGTRAVPFFDPVIFVTSALGTLSIISIGSIYKTLSLRGGGAAVARSVGARPINPHTQDPLERRFVNVVEEMAIASGTPVPAVYVMDREPSINAFAAGWTTEDAAVSVTRGCLEQLNRDELQGVIAHEFSHIVNGDMRLNLRLMGLLHGILLISIIGYWVMRVVGGGRGRRGKGAGQVMLVGLALFILGYIGLFFGRLIQAAVSRQREFLADASAVQFTRNPAGIEGALKKIGGYAEGSRIESPGGVSASHLFFGKATKAGNLFGWLSTHPPLDERIRRIDPNFDGEFQQITAANRDRIAAEAAAAVPLAAGAAGFAGGTPAARPAAATPAPRPATAPRIAARATDLVNQVGAPSAGHMDYAREVLGEIPAAIRHDAYEPFGAVALVFALLMDPDPDELKKQLTILRADMSAPIIQQTLRSREALDAVDPRARLPILDLCAPALRQLGPDQYARFRRVVHQLVHADQKVTLFEFALGKVIEHRLDAVYQRPKPRPAQFHSIRPLLGDAAQILTALAYGGHHDPAEIAKAYHAGMSRLADSRDDGLGLRPRESCTANVLDGALERLAGGSPAVKQRIVDACAHTVLADGEVTLSEAELLRAIAESLLVPIPPFLPTVAP